MPHSLVMLRETVFWHHNYILVFPCQTFNHQGHQLSTPHLTQTYNPPTRAWDFQQVPGLLLKAPCRLGAVRCSSSCICSVRFSIRVSGPIDCWGSNSSVLLVNSSFKYRSVYANYKCLAVVSLRDSYSITNKERLYK